MQIGRSSISVAMWVKHESGVPLLDCSAGATQDNLVLDLSNGITWRVRVGCRRRRGHRRRQLAFPTNEWKRGMVVQEVGLETTEASIYGRRAQDERVGLQPRDGRSRLLPAKTRDSASGEFVGETCAALRRRTRAPAPRARTPFHALCRPARHAAGPTSTSSTTLSMLRSATTSGSKAVPTNAVVACHVTECSTRSKPSPPPPAAAEPAAPVLAAGAAAEPAAAEPAAEPAAAEPATALAASPGGPAVPAAAAATVPAEVPGELATAPPPPPSPAAAAAGAAADAAQTAIGAVRRVCCHGGRGPAGAVLQDLRERRKMTTPL